MEKESPVNLRKSLKLVEYFRKAGIGFIPIPILGENDRMELIEMIETRIEQIAKMQESDERTRPKTKSGGSTA